MSEFEYYQSPFSFRYGSPEMRRIWSEQNKRTTWRKIWIALAQAEMELGLVSKAQLDDLHQHMNDIDIPRAMEYEAINKHDLMAELKVFAEQCPIGGGIIHLGATSMDIKDNAEAILIIQSLNLVESKLKSLLLATAALIDKTADRPCMAYTHLQPAEPTTLGYRFANFAQDLISDYESIAAICRSFKGKGFKGAVGNAASYIELFGMDGFTRLEASISTALNVPFYDVSTQTYPRKQEYDLLAALSGLSGTLYKFAFDLRLLQSQGFAEIAEPFSAQQVGSSAMPFKRNPIHSEKIDSLARAVSTAPMVAWQNASHSLLERTLDDSANRRSLLPDTFLALDELVMTSTYLIDNLQINNTAIERNLAKYGPFSAIERILLATVKHGANRQEMHEILRNHSMAAWEEMETGGVNPLVDLLISDSKIIEYLTSDQIQNLLDVKNYLGFSVSRSRILADNIKERFKP